jgi:hypothetical protein
MAQKSRKSRVLLFRRRATESGDVVLGRVDNISWKRQKEVEGKAKVKLEFVLLRVGSLVEELELQLQLKTLQSQSGQGSQGQATLPGSYL